MFIWSMLSETNLSILFDITYIYICEAESQASSPKPRSKSQAPASTK